MALIVLDPAKKVNREADALEDRVVPQALRLLSSLVQEIVSRGRRAMLVSGGGGGNSEGTYSQFNI